MGAVGTTKDWTLLGTSDKWNELQVDKDLGVGFRFGLLGIGLGRLGLAQVKLGANESTNEAINKK